jgi:hypothetical protein
MPEHADAPADRVLRARILPAGSGTRFGKSC